MSDEKRAQGEVPPAESDDLGFEELLEQSFAPRKRLNPGDKIETRVVSVGSEYVFLDLGGRTEGLLHREDAAGENGEMDLKEGDKITVFVTGFRDGAIICGTKVGVSSRGGERSDDKNTKLDELSDAYNAGLPVEGQVKESIKGGFTISLLGNRAFCPISQIDNKYCETPEEHIGKTYTFEIIKFEEDGRNIVVSRRKILDAEKEEKAAEIWQTLDVGQTYQGVVSSVRAFGAFVDIGGVDGLLHVSEISHGHVSDPKEALEAGQKIEVAILDIDRAKKRISLSLKALLQDPFEEAVKVLKPNQICQGRVIRIAQFGAFVELTPGVEGLVHISEMGGEKRIQTPREVVAPDQEVTVRILQVDPGQQRISLSMNLEANEDNWKEELAQSTSSSKDNQGMGTLGDLLKNKLGK